MTGFATTRRGLLMAGGAALALGALPRTLRAQEALKVAGIYTVPVEQQWVSRIHKAAEAARAAGRVDTPSPRMWPTPTIPASCANMPRAASG